MSTALSTRPNPVDRLLRPFAHGPSGDDLFALVLFACVFFMLMFTSSRAAAEPVLPGNESGRIDPHDTTDSIARKVGRGVLYVPRVVLSGVFAPVEGAIFVTERYQVAERLHRLMWNDAETIGLVPTFQLESGFGLNGGGHLILRDLFDRDERFDLRANAGGRYSQRYVASAYSGRALGSTLAIGSQLEYERRPGDRFYGIGNADNDTAAAAQLAPVDPMTAESSRFRHDFVRALAIADLRLGSGVLIRTSGAVADHEMTSPGGDDSIANRYMTAQLPGFDGYRTAYGEIEARWDTRRTARDTEPASNFSTGGLLSVFAGRIHGLAGTPDFWRYGGDAQRFLWLAEGPRVLVARLHVEGVTGSVDEIPFHELPRLGGKDLLRGYPGDRFRDRLGVVGTLEYRWDLVKALSASAFVDAGRVYRSPGDLELDNLRVGYGVSLEAHTDSSFLARISLASSIDGGAFLDFSLDPVFAVAGRVQRR